MNQNKWEQLMKLLSYSSADAVMLWRPEELVMLLGYYPFWSNSILVLKKDGRMGLFIPDNEPLDNIPGEVQIITYKFGCRPFERWNALGLKICQFLEGTESKERILARMKGRSLTFGAIASVNTAIPDELESYIIKYGSIEFIDFTREIQELLVVKNERDLEGIRLANQAASYGIKTFYQNLNPGISELKLQCLVESAIVCSSEQNKYVRAWAYVQSGANTIDAGKYNCSSQKILKENELVLLELAVCVDGFWADLTRTGYVGNPNGDIKWLYQTISVAQSKAQMAATAGAETKKVYQAAAQYLQEQNVLQYFPHDLGHPVGYCYHDYGPVIGPKQEDILKDGMVITLEPGIYDASFGGMRVENNYWITSKGCINITNCQSGLRGESDA